MSPDHPAVSQLGQAATVDQSSAFGSPAIALLERRGFRMLSAAI